MVNKIRWNQVKELFNFSSELGEKNEHEAIFFLSELHRNKIFGKISFPIWNSINNWVFCVLTVLKETNSSQYNWFSLRFSFLLFLKKKKDKIKRKLSVEVIVPHILIQAAQNKLKKKN